MLNDSTSNCKSGQVAQSENPINSDDVTLGNVTYEIHRTFSGTQSVGELLYDCILHQTNT